MLVLKATTAASLASVIRQWKRIPKSILTFADMIDANIYKLIEAFNRMLWLREFARHEMEVQLTPPVSDGYSQHFREILTEMGHACSDAGLSASRDCVMWVEYQTQGAQSQLTFQSIFMYCEQIYGALAREVSDQQFLLLKRPEYYSRLDDPERKKQFGEQVEKAFPGAIPEIVGACNCFALEEWTACVFYCMRVLESPLVALARRFLVPYERAEWHNIIEGIESKVRAIDSNYGPTWKEDQKFFGEAARHLMFIKNGWRNHVMHVRDEYDEGKAMSILQHTKELTIHLAGKLFETS